MSKEGENNHSWRGGRCEKGNYIRIYTTESKHRYSREHVLVAEKALGKKLPFKACIHHISENKHNNLNSNLVICQDSSYHALLHVHKCALVEIGNANNRKCCFCHKYDNIKNMYRSKIGNGWHRECRNKVNKEKKN